MSLLDDLKNLAINDQVKRELRDVAKGLGLPKLRDFIQELEARAEEVRSLSGRIRALALALFTGYRLVEARAAVSCCVGCARYSCRGSPCTARPG